MTMSENREFAGSRREKMRVWSCPIERFVTARCEAGMRVSMD